jgi:polyhydroxybutyrate depolymerase
MVSIGENLTFRLKIAPSLKRNNLVSSSIRRLLFTGLAMACCLGKGMAAEPVIMPWYIGRDTRAAIVYPPAVKDRHAKSPLIFVFHGHGDNAWFATEQFPFQKLWPEAIVVFPQGIPTPSASDPQGERRGWQHEPGEVGDRDLKFFDAMLRTLRWQYRVDDQRIYAAGFSNGGFFDYILWAQRGDRFAAFAPCAAALRAPLQLTIPKPVFVVAGEKDDRVPFPEQRKTIDALRQVNGCPGAGQAWGDPRVQRYESPHGAPVVAFVHAGGHAVPPPITVLMTEFLKQQTLRH